MRKAERGRECAEDVGVEERLSATMTFCGRVSRRPVAEAGGDMGMETGMETGTDMVTVGGKNAGAWTHDGRRQQTAAGQTQARRECDLALPPVDVSATHDHKHALDGANDCGNLHACAIQRPLFSLCCLLAWPM